MHEDDRQPGFLRSFTAIALVGAVAYGAYRVNGEMQPLVDTWHKMVTDLDDVTGANYYFEKNTNYSIGIGTSAADCLAGSDAEVKRVKANPADQQYDLYVRHAGQAAFDLSAVSSCIVKATGADITVRVVPVG
jgi:hypothetical protein